MQKGHIIITIKDLYKLNAVWNLLKKKKVMELQLKKKSSSYSHQRQVIYFLKEKISHTGLCVLQLYEERCFFTFS